jgi:hypothetical protein
MAEREAIRPDGKVGPVQKLYAVYRISIVLKFLMKPID